MNLKLLFVRLAPAVLRALVQRAEAQRRRPQDEAALIIEDALGMKPVSTEKAGVRSPCGDNDGNVRRNGEDDQE